MKTIKGVIFTVEEIEKLNEEGYLVDLQLLDDDGDYPDGNCVIVNVDNFSKEEIKSLNLEERIMEDLVKEGETLCSESNGNFTEFAEVNGFNVETVEAVFDEHDQYLTAIYLFNNKEVKLDAITNFLDVSADEYRESIERNSSIDNGMVNIEFEFVKKEDPLYESVVKVFNIEEL